MQITEMQITEMRTPQQQAMHMMAGVDKIHIFRKEECAHAMLIMSIFTKCQTLLLHASD
jgi:hypothetical protein